MCSLDPIRASSRRSRDCCAGYVAQGNRDDVLTNVPRFYKDRFGHIVGNKAPCPEKPWWAVWK
jgi:hypothetical protein